jgi:S-formylglutathione hydrolase FrmB
MMWWAQPGTVWCLGLQSDAAAATLMAECSTLSPARVQDGQLKPEDLQAANEGGKLELEVRMQEGYDHSYFFIATFAEDHLRMHAKAMGL